MTQFIIIVLVIAFLILMALYANYRENKRREKIRLLAESLGLEYAEVLPIRDQERFTQLPIAQRGNNAKNSSVIIAESEDQRMLVFNYEYTTGSGKNRTTHHYSILMCISERLKLPAMTLQPEGWQHKIATFFGGQDIQFEDDAQFNTTYIVQGPKADAIRAFWTPPRRQKMLERPKEMFEASNDTFIVYRARKQLQADQVHQLMQDGLAMWEILRA